MCDLMRVSAAIVMDRRFGGELVVFPELNLIHVEVRIILKAHFGLVRQVEGFSGDLNRSVLHGCPVCLDGEPDWQIKIGDDPDHLHGFGVHEHSSGVGRDGLLVTPIVDHEVP